MKEENFFKLGEICDIVTGKLDANAMVEDGKYPFFTCDPHPFKIDTFAFDCECVLIGGNNASGNFPINYFNGKFNAYQRTYVITKKPDSIVNIRYVYYHLKLALLELKKRSSGSVTKFLTMGLLENIKIPVKKEEEYNNISNILFSFDTAIKNNSEIIQNIREYCNLLYHKWFVDFNFPDKNGLAYKDNGGSLREVEGKMIPVNWSIVSLSHFVADTLVGDWGESEKQEGLDEILCIRGADIPGWINGEVRDTPIRYINLSRRKEKALIHGDIVVEASGGSPTQSTGRTILIRDSMLSSIDKPVFCSNFSKILRLREKQYSTYFNEILSNLYRRGVLFHYEGKTTGIKNLLLPRLLDKFKVVMPSSHLLIEFDSIVGLLYDKINIIGRQNELLSETRDLLNKKLIS